MPAEPNIYERQLAGAVMRSIENTTPGFHAIPRKSGASIVIPVVLLALVLGFVALAMSKRADAGTAYPLDSKAVRP